MKQYSENPRENISAVCGLYSNQSRRNTAGTLTPLVINAEVRSSAPAMEPPTRIGRSRLVLLKASEGAAVVIVFLQWRIGRLSGMTVIA
jgi:hypothetical protein